jgi:hypothetical protein
VIIFDSVRFLLKKNNQTEKKNFLKKPKPNRNRFKPTGFGSVRFLGQKPVQTGLARFFWFWLGLARFFPVWLGFFQVFFGLGSIRFFRFFTYKTEPNRPVF